MFMNSLTRDLALEVALRREELLRPQLDPDWSPVWHGLRRLVQWAFRRGSTRDLSAESLTVPDDHLGLVFVDEQPLKLIPAGGLLVPDPGAKVKARWLHRERLPHGFETRSRLEQLSLLADLPFEREFLFLDGRMVALGVSTASRPNRALMASAPLRPVSSREMASCLDLDEETYQGFSFV